MFFETCSNIPPPYWKLEAAGLGSWCRAGRSRSWVSSATVAVGADVVSTSLVFVSLRICPPNSLLSLLLVNLDPPLFSTWLATVNLTSGSGYFPECNFWERCFCACHLSRSHYRSGSCPRPNHAWSQQRCILE